MCVCEFGPRVQRVWPTIVSSFEVATWLKDVEEEQWITDSSIRAVFFFSSSSSIYSKRNELCRIESRKYDLNVYMMEGWNLKIDVGEIIGNFDHL